MKKTILIIIILILVPNVLGTTYYFSNSGNDSNNCQSEENACQTITKSNSISYSPGDSVLFKRGDTWRSTTDAYMGFRSGNSSHKIIYGAYGSGDKPKFLGSHNLSSSASWSNGVGGNIWNTSGSYTTEIGNLIFNGEESISTRSMTYAGLDVQGEYYYDYTARTISLYSVSNPGTYYNSIEAARRTPIFSISSKSHIIIENLDLRYSGELGFNIVNSHNITIRNNTVGFIGGSRVSSTDATRFGNCIQTWITARDILITNNYVYECFDAALTSQSNQGSGAQSILNVTWSYNVVRNSHYCWEYFNTHSDSNTQNLYVTQNTFIDCGSGLLPLQNPNAAYCLMGNTNPPTTTTQYWTNNICYNTTKQAGGTEYFVSTGRGSSTAWKGNFPILNHNLYYISDATNQFQWNATTYSNLSNFKTGTGQESNGVYTNPLFVDFNGGDYRPSADSPACTMSSTGSYVGALPCEEETLCMGKRGIHCNKNGCFIGIIRCTEPSILRVNSIICTIGGCI